MAKISVIIPIYKVEKYLRRCLDSVANQTFKDWEAICVNDGSPDNSCDILAKFASIDERFRIINKKNGGLSDARNVGMQHATSDYIMFLDSDDFIHPQTMEISYFLAKRDSSDIVTWYKDKYFRPVFMLRHYLGLNTDSALPKSIKRRFSIDSVKSFYTEDIFAHAYEASKEEIKWPIKHCYVWRFLMKRELIENVEFIKGLKYEDFPWWSEVLLKNPKTTITNLPFYYYFPNPGSILMSTDRATKMYNWIKGISATYKLYKENANVYQMRCWKKHFLWPVIDGQICRKLILLKNEEDKKKIREALTEFERIGLPDNAIIPEYATSANRLKDFIAGK